jgi:hypothetical protein
VAPDWIRLIGSSLVSFMLSYMLMKVWLPFAPRRAGEVLLEVPLGFLQRVLVHRTQAIFLLLYLILGTLPGTGTDLFYPGTAPIGLLGMLAIMLLPLRYVFTERGVGLNNGVPRAYRTFRRFDVRAGRRWLASNVTIMLRGRRAERGTHPSYALFIPKAAQADVVRFLKRHVR